MTMLFPVHIAFLFFNEKIWSNFSSAFFVSVMCKFLQWYTIFEQLDWFFQRYSSFLAHSSSGNELLKMVELELQSSHFIHMIFLYKYQYFLITICPFLHHFFPFFWKSKKIHKWWVTNRLISFFVPENNVQLYKIGSSSIFFCFFQYILFYSLVLFIFILDRNSDSRWDIFFFWMENDILYRNLENTTITYQTKWYYWYWHKFEKYFLYIYIYDFKFTKYFSIKLYVLLLLSFYLKIILWYIYICIF